MKLLIILITILFSVSWAFRNAYQRKEAGVNHNANRKWHLWEFIIKCCFAAVIILLTEGFWSKGWGLLMVASIDFLLFPIVLNWRTGQNWDYLSMYGVDKYLRKIPSHFLFVIKCLLAIVSTFFYWINPFS